MDIGLRMKSIDLLVKFMSHDLKRIGKDQPVLKKQAAECAQNPKPLERSAPEAMGIRSDALAAFFEGLGEDVNPHGVLVLRRGSVVGEAHWAPYRAGVPHMLYSMSKSVTATAVGIAADEGLLSLDEKLVDIFRDKVPAAQGLLLRNVTVRHLLSMSVGIRFNEVGSALSEDWERMYLESLPKFDPGSAFEYNSMNSYMLAAILRRKTGMGLAEYLKERLFDPLGIERYAWETCPRGTEKGGWGLALTLEDAAKLGELYRRGGTWPTAQGGEERLLSEEWVREATRKQIDTPHGENKHGYGFQIWMDELPGAYLFSGAFGQYVVVLPHYEAVVALFSGSARLFSNSRIREGIAMLFEEGSENEALPENPEVLERLSGVVSALSLRAADDLSDASVDAGEFEGIAEELAGREYRLEENVAGVFPLVLQGVHMNFTEGVFLLRFERTKDGLDLALYEGADCNRLPLRPDGYADCLVAVGEEEHLASVRCQWRRDPDGAIALRASVAFLETPNLRVITLFVRGERLDAVFDERPDATSSAGMLFELSGYSHMEYLRTLVPQMRKAHIAGRLRNLLEPETKGRLIAHRRVPPPAERFCER